MRWIEIRLPTTLRRSSKVTYRHGIARAKQLQQVVFQMATSVTERASQVCRSVSIHCAAKSTTAESTFFVQLFI